MRARGQWWSLPMARRYFIISFEAHAYASACTQGASARPPHHDMPRCCAHTSPIKCRINSGTHHILGSRPLNSAENMMPFEKGVRCGPNKTYRIETRRREYLQETYLYFEKPQHWRVGTWKSLIWYKDWVFEIYASRVRSNIILLLHINGLYIESIIISVTISFFTCESWIIIICNKEISNEIDAILLEWLQQYYRMSYFRLSHAVASLNIQKI